MSVLGIVRREAARLRRWAGIAQVALPAAALVGVLTAAAGVLDGGRWLSLPAALPVLAWLVAAALTVLSVRLLMRRLLPRTETRAVAAAIEAEQGLRRGALTGLLEVEGSGVFADHAAEALGASLHRVATRPAPLLRRRVAQATWIAAAALAQVLLLATVSFARRTDGWRAVLNPVDAWRGVIASPLRFVEPPGRVLRGAAVDLAIDAPGRVTVDVRWRATGGAWQEALADVDASGRAALRIPTADADLTILVTDGRAGRDSATVRVVDRPFVGDVSVTARYPGYLLRAAERLASDVPLRVPEGTVLELSGRASEPLEAARLVADSREVRLLPEGARFSGRFVPTGHVAWRFDVRGSTSDSLDVPPPLEIEVVADSLPRVEILSPTNEVLADSAASVTLDLLAQDDNALARVALRIARVGSDSGAREVELSARRELVWTGGASLRVADLGLKAGEAVQVSLVARDAAPGARDAVSAPLVIRVPTAAEARAAAREAGDAAVAAAEAAARAQAELALRTENEARARNDRGAAAREEAADRQRPGQQQQQPREPLGFENAERAREIGEQQRQLAGQVEQLENAARELEDRLRSAGALDTGLARQLQEAQQMLRDAMTPEMQAAMSRLNESTQQLDGQRTRQSMAELAQQQQRLRETLERSAEMLRRAALEGQMQTVADQGRDLAREQRALADSAQRGNNVQTEAERLERETQQFARDAQRLAERLEQANAQRGAEQAQRSATEAAEAARQLDQAPRDPQAAERAAQSMERSAESMADARRDQVADWKQELTDALDRSVQEMMQMAREQDALANQARDAQSSDDLRGQQSALQQGVQAAQQRLEQESRRSTLVTPRSQELMERAQQRAAQATREASEGRRGQAEQAMRESADALRQAAAQLTRDRERATRSRSATGMAEMMEQMQQLAQQQGGLNSQMQSLMQMMAQQQQAGRQGMDAQSREQARQLSRSQREVARRLEEVGDADPTGRAQEMAREARALASALDQGAVDPSTQARQERLFRRMLDAGRSLEQEQRDESQRREARAARNPARVTPSGDVNAAPAERYAVPTWEELRGLSAEDRRLVIEYFRKLNQGARP